MITNPQEFELIDATQVWLQTLQKIMTWGKQRAPRGKPTSNLQHNTIVLDMKRPVVTVVERKLSYQFMAAEAHWILAGDNRVSTIAGYNKHISQFSDDGKIFAGAYGPMVVSQLEYVVGKLVEDRETRQSVMTIWEPNPEPSKDIPCTVAIGFEIEGNQLHCHVYMRSSDAWLGLPYDMFNFSMLSYMVAAQVNGFSPDDPVEPGRLHLTMISSHLYETNFDAARQCLSTATRPQKPATPDLWDPAMDIVQYLGAIRDTTPGDALRWWELP